MLFTILDQEFREIIRRCPCSIWSICRLCIYVNTIRQISPKAYKLANVFIPCFKIQIRFCLKWRSVVQPTHMFQNGIKKKKKKKGSCSRQGTIKTTSLVIGEGGWGGAARSVLCLIRTVCAHLSAGAINNLLVHWLATVPDCARNRKDSECSDLPQKKTRVQLELKKKKIFLTAPTVSCISKIYNMTEYATLL